MPKIELIETIDPPTDAMVRTFHCAVCDKDHLQSGPIARVWVYYQEGYATQASPECLEATSLREKQKKQVELFREQQSPPTPPAMGDSTKPACNCTFNYGSHMPKCAITEWQRRQ